MVDLFTKSRSRSAYLGLAALWLAFIPNWPTYVDFYTSPAAGVGLTAVAFTLGSVVFVWTVCFCLLALLGLPFRGKGLRWIVAVVIVIAAILSYFSYFLGTHFDKTMLLNVMQTHADESLELLNWRLLAWVVFFGVLPACYFFRLGYEPRGSWLAKVLQPLGVAALGIALTTGVVLSMYSKYASAARARTITFDTVAPANIVAAGISLWWHLRDASIVRAPVGEDAKLGAPLEKPRLVIFILGETARAQNIGLNGYERKETSARMQAEGGLYFPDTASCGTATAISLPCIFSGLKREEFNLVKGRNRQTLIDVVARTGARVIWRDNDSGCKGVCDASEYLNFTRNTSGPYCETGDGCIDAILFQGLEQQVLEKSASDTLLVLHLKGSHGPAYYKRYPKKFEKFTPTCQSSDLSSCPVEHIRNAYDNTLVYSDHLVGETIALAKKLADRFTPVVLYVSDHGESLGENGVFLHGLPYAIAPKEQTRVPLYAWFSPSYSKAVGFEQSCLEALTKTPRSHDNIYSTILGLMGVQTSVYQPGLDIFASCASKR